jgi:hypothetical protein
VPLESNRGRRQSTEGDEKECTPVGGKSNKTVIGPEVRVWKVRKKGK